MIVRLHKYLLFGNRSEVDRFFAAAQEEGFLEFIGENRKRALELPEEAKTLLAALKIAKQHEIHPEEGELLSLEPQAIAERILSFRAALEKEEEEKRVIEAEIARVAVFGNFSQEDRDAIEKEGRRILQFFCMKSDLARDLTIPSEMIYIGTEYDLDYFVAIHKERKTYDKMIEIFIDRPMGVLVEALSAIRLKIARLQRDLRAHANAFFRLQEALSEVLSVHHLELAKYDATEELNCSLFSIEAWVPETRIKDLKKLVGPFSIEAIEICIEERDQVPTCMENTGGGKLGEDLVRVYDIPAHTDKDPSWWVLLFFSLFFAMIVSDAGYGLIYLGITLFLKFRFPKMEEFGKRFLRICFLCSATAIAWGVATGSYFGMEIGPDNPLRKSSFLYFLAQHKASYHLEMQDDVYEEYLKDYPALSQAKTGREFLELSVKETPKGEEYKALDEFYDNLFMEFSFLAGILHISLGLLRNVKRNYAALGWVLFILGGYLFFPSMLDATTLFHFMGWISKPVAHTLGLQLIWTGIALAFIAALFQKKWGALSELLNVIQVFADILSYLRLYALALGGMVMAKTFNDRLGIDLGFVSGAFVILAGHLVNITLTTMGGVIHGLRLNFLEWYHYCFEGGGRLFNPLRLYKKQ